jgi:hypothetical protein
MEFDVVHYNHNLLIKIRDARRKINLPIENYKQPYWAHFLKKKVIEIETKKEFTILEIAKYWHAGWYVKAEMVDKDGKSYPFYIASINCINNEILDKIEVDNQKYQTLLTN